MMSDHHKLNNNKIINLNDWVDFEQNFHDEDYFQEALRIERKRSERSGKPFLLMLVDIKRLINGKNGKIIYVYKLIYKRNRYKRLAY